jgi:glycolate oxidase FAD binding subunit
MDTFVPDSVDDLVSFVATGVPLSVHSRVSPSAGVTSVDLSKLSSIVAYPAADMTITVQSGVTVAAIQTTLAEHNQHLPIDVAEADKTFIGDAVAWNLNGSRRFGCGTFRDYVIGVSAIDGQGRLFKSGGQVVKNVAGYDLCKLLTGSHGTLGVMTQLTFKVLPRPVATGGVRLLFESPADAEPVLEKLTVSGTRPTAIDLLTAEGRTSLVIVFNGTEAEVVWQQEELRKELGSGHFSTMTSQDVADHLRFTSAVHQPGARRFIAGLRPSVETRFVQQANCPIVVAHAGNGIVVGDSGSLRAVQSMAEGLGGWCRANAIDSQPFVAGTMSDTMRKVKQAFDPSGILNAHIEL